MNTKTRKQHRRMLEELQKLVDKACDSDRLFFERKRDRKYRIRRSHRAEILQNHLLSRDEFDSRQHQDRSRSMIGAQGRLTADRLRISSRRRWMIPMSRAPGSPQYA
jgi:hypothetical protein